ncbi:sodium-coupled neutral amino acid transporter 5 isoform X4 [Acinonyx jubatus]|uniref:Sodium-coupled neutral amino acid transporter 5 isoform X4 n=1 Tax=Acinonyx jubatus TaxID=32536 RepID=A0A6J1YYP4_ACIJB|nr:sodium-coupled neutral amino acid transporter 5 isoform X4 [Acinonyx jubatus]
MAISSAVGMELQDPKMNGALPADALGYRQEREGFLPSHPPAPGRKPIEFMDFEGKTSFGMSVFNLSNAIMGSGILGLAYAMAHTGVLFFLALLLCIAFLSSYSIHLLLTCAGVVGIRAYEQLGQRALGPAGKVVVAAVICLHNVGAMSSYLFIIKSELPLVIGTFLDMDPEGGWFLKGNLLIIIVSVLIILPLALMRHLGYLGYTSGLSLTCMLFFLISVIYKKFQLGCPVGLNETEVESKNPTAFPIQGLNRSCEAHMFTVDSQMFYTVPIMAFAFVCHPEVLPIYTELCRPSKHRMQAVANVSIGAMFCMYGLTATFGYLTFYRSTSAPSLIFILPSIFYLRIVPTEVEPLYSWPKIQALCFGLLGVLFMAISLGFMFANWATGQSPVSGH